MIILKGIGIVLLVIYIIIVLVFTVFLTIAVVQDKIEERKRRKNENL